MNHSFPQSFAAQDNAAERAERITFIRRTFVHLAFAILGFVSIESLLLQWDGAPALVNTMMGGRISWLLVLGAFMAVSWVADRWARSEASPGMQYAGLVLYVTAEAVLFLPLLFVATYFAGPEVIPTAGIITGLLFVGLVITAFTLKTNFSFLGPILSMGSMVALGFIICAMIFGFSLGLFFSTIMCLFAGGSILYTLSNIRYEFRPDQHVAASLVLFAGVALLFWYVLQILLSLGRRN